MGRRRKQLWVVFWKSDIGIHERKTVSAVSAEQACNITNNDCCGAFQTIRDRMFAVPVENAEIIRKRKDYKDRRTSAPLMRVVK